MTPPESGDPSGMTLSELVETLMRDRWAGAHALRGEYPRLVVIPADEFASYSATVDRRHQIVVIPGDVGVADVVYVCIKNAADAYAWLDVSTQYAPVTGTSTSDLKNNMVTNDLVADGGATPLNLDGGALTAGAVSGTTGTFSGAVSGTTGTFSGKVTGDEVEINGDLNHDGTRVGFYGFAPALRGTVIGDKNTNTAGVLGLLLAVLENTGLIDDQTT